jgi:hypothetical protein
LYGVRTRHFIPSVGKKEETKAIKKEEKRTQGKKMRWSGERAVKHIP